MQDRRHCGDWPIKGEPETVELFEGVPIRNLDFPITLDADLGITSTR